MRKLASIVAILLGLAFMISGAVAWGTISSQLADENITVPDDAPWSQGDKVDGPISAFAQAEIIKEHALHGSDGKTYAELGSLAREAEAAGDTAAAEKYQEQRTSVMNGSFLRASLFTSVLAYGVSALAAATGLSMLLSGLAGLAKRKHHDHDHVHHAAGSHRDDVHRDTVRHDTARHDDVHRDTVRHDDVRVDDVRRTDVRRDGEAGTTSY